MPPGIFGGFKSGAKLAEKAGFGGPGYSGPFGGGELLRRGCGKLSSTCATCLSVVGDRSSAPYSSHKEGSPSLSLGGGATNASTRVTFSMLLRRFDDLHRKNPPAHMQTTMRNAATPTAIKAAVFCSLSSEPLLPLASEPVLDGVTVVGGSVARVVGTTVTTVAVGVGTSMLVTITATPALASAASIPAWMLVEDPDTSDAATETVFVVGTSMRYATSTAEEAVSCRMLPSSSPESKRRCTWVIEVTVTMLPSTPLMPAAIPFSIACMAAVFPTTAVTSVSVSLIVPS
mmetsp:Transcript_4517/g.9817  ORF Transcript_4517/g.9817 Transcript_4517/m.9817 type:complete len:288 (+) Transcript_4517:175-1038(+)